MNWLSLAALLEVLGLYLATSHPPFPALATLATPGGSTLDSTLWEQVEEGP